MRDGLGRRAARRLAALGSRPQRSPARCDYAQILDGERLWLSVTGPFSDASSLALRDESNGELTRVTTDVETAASGVSLSARIALTGPDAVRRFGPGDRVLLAVEDAQSDGSSKVHAVQADVPVGGISPSRVPPTRDETLLFTLGRDRHGAVRLTCEAVSAAAIVKRLGQRDETFEVSCTLPQPVGEARLVLVDGDDGPPVYDLPLSGETDLQVSLPLRLVGRRAGKFPLAVDAGDERWPVVRGHNGLRAPQHGVTLPLLVLADEHGSATRYALVYLGSGQLALNIRPVDDRP